MAYIIIQLFPALIVLLALSVPLGIVMWLRFQYKSRRSPLTADMLRAPGESTSKRIEDLDEEVDLNMTFAGLSPLLCYSSYLTARHLAGIDVSPASFIGLAVICSAFFSFRLYRAMKQRTNERLGLDCERAVGQELNQLMLANFRVYHDFPAGNFNIDHIVIGPNGVFAIETKGRAKRERGRGKADATVVYDGHQLRFPQWNEREPLEQAERQAEWLSKWLSSAVGETVQVKAVLALPGWYIDRQKPGFLLYNGKNPQFLLKIIREPSLSDDMIYRVAHQLEQQCRDVEPLAYKRR